MREQEVLIESPVLLCRPAAESHNSCHNVALSSSSGLPTPIVVSLQNASPSRPNNNVNCRKPGPLPANLDEMKVCTMLIHFQLVK